MIVQDLAKEIDGRALSEGVEGMAYDFMEPQPVKGIYPFIQPCFPYRLFTNLSTSRILSWDL